MALDDQDLAVAPTMIVSPGADDLRMIAMTNQENRSPRARMPCHLQVHFGHQRTRGIYHSQLTPLCLGIYVLRHAVGAEQNNGAVGNFGEILDELGALRAQLFHDVPVVDDLMPDVDRGSEHVERLPHGADGALDSGAETADIGEQNLHVAFLLDIRRETAP